jgi:murein DD-endopeptidase MepM/ murein hydrolase activator NlpD
MIPAVAVGVLALAQAGVALSGLPGLQPAGTAAAPAAGSGTDAAAAGIGPYTPLRTADPAEGGVVMGPVAVAQAAARAAMTRRPTRDDARRPPVALPVWSGTPISGEFGEVGSHWPSGHGGLDFNGETGDPVFAATNGRVIHAGFNHGGFGNLVMILRGDGVQTWYAHLDSIAVKVGERVRAGERIGRMGSTGDSTGAHLHFEVRVGSVPTPTDPRHLLFGRNRGYASKPPAWACAKWGC